MEKYVPFIEEFCKRMGIDDDCRQMVYVALLEKDPSLLEGLDSRGEMRFYLVKMIQRMQYGQHSAYNKLYKKNGDPIEEDTIDENEWLNAMEYED